MAFFDGVMNFVKKFREAAQMGADFNPMPESIEKEIKQLHAQGKLDDVLYKTEQEYVKERGEYISKSSTTAADSMAENNALKHFIRALANDANMSDELKVNANKLLELHDKMLSILGPLGNIAK